MSYIVNSIVKIIKDNFPSNGEEAIFKIDGFDDLKIYECVADQVTKCCQLSKLSVEIKLAKTRWNYFDKHCNDTSVKTRMQNNGWIADAESVTYYRNLHASDVLILMGTEAEEDKGGLMNCFTINPQLIAENLKGKYSRMFSIVNSTKTSKESIDKAYQTLFTCCALDICKLSKMLDERGKDFYDLDEFNEWFNDTLPEWGLPYIIASGNFSSTDRITKLLSNAYKFISRSLTKYFAVSKANYKKVASKINKYRENKDGKSTFLSYTDWYINGVSSFDELEKVLLEFVSGTNIALNRDKLLHTPFEIVSEILNTSEKVQGPDTPAVDSVYGDPLKVIIETMLGRLIVGKKSNYPSISKVVYKVDSIELITSTSESDSSNELLNAWLPIAYYTNGVFEYVNNKTWTYNKNDVEVELLNDGLFDPSKAWENTNDAESSATIITKAGPSKKMNNVSFTIYCFDEDDEELEDLKREFSWKFTNDEDWINYFRDFIELGSNGLSKFVPLGISTNIEKLIFSNSNEEFFDRYEKNELTFNSNFINDLFSKITNPYLMQVLTKYEDLASSFGELVNTITNEGFFKCLLKINSPFVNVCARYSELGQELVNTTISDVDMWIKESYIYAFSIIPSTRIIDSEDACSSCVVTPWHPATLQKIGNQKVFFLDGCAYWWKKVEDGFEDASEVKLNYKIDTLVQMSVIQSGVDVFKHDQECFGVKNSFGGYSTYCLDKYAEVSLRLDDIVRKDAVFEDDFSITALSAFNDDAKMIYEILEKYAKSFSYYCDNLNLTFVYPQNLQPIVSALSKYIIEFKNRSDDKLTINLNILVNSKNKGGKNYLEYWMNSYFNNDEFENVKIRTYLKEITDLDEVKNESEVLDYCPDKTDIVFLLDFLSFTGMDFVEDNNPINNASGCMFPIVYKPSAGSNQSTRRHIEISQPQFPASYQHTQVVKSIKDPYTGQNYIAVKNVNFKVESIKIVNKLHDKANWVVCIDQGMDGALLEAKADEKTYEVIGYSTGKGSYGQYNYTITAKPKIIESLKSKLYRRLKLLFKWDDLKLKKTVDLCIKEAGKLDGISLFSAVNISDYNINEFMAYVLTSILVGKDEQCIPETDRSPLKTIIHLDSYQHWFTNADVKSNGDSNSRPDFLIVEVVKDDVNDFIKLKAKVVECKISSAADVDEHINKATSQVKYGIKKLQEIFNPNTDDVTKRYWFAQLYRALIFSGITFTPDIAKVNDTIRKLRLILDGKFEIEWDGEVYGYWIESDNSNITNEIVNSVKLRNIPQIVIQRLLTEEDSPKYVDNNFQLILDNDPEKVSNEEIISSIYGSTSDDEYVNDDFDYNDYSDNNYDSNNVDDNNESEESDLNDDNSEENNNQESSDITNTKPEDLEPENIVVEESNKDEEESEEYRPTLSEDDNIYIGKTHGDKEIYWEFGNPGLGNKHLVITGTSGQGKTYCMQALLSEVVKLNVSSVIIDYAEGFTETQIEKEFKEKLGNRFEEHFVKIEGVPVNPFKALKEVYGNYVQPEKPGSIADRITELLNRAFDLGTVQEGILYDSMVEGLEKYGDGMNFDILLEILRSKDKKENTVNNMTMKMRKLFDSVSFNTKENLDWGNIIYNKEAKVTVLQLTNIPRETQKVITEFLVWDLFGYAKSHCNKYNPFVLVLDEAQNLSFQEGKPMYTVMKEGRKFGMSIWLATQNFSSFSKEEKDAITQASTRISFKPTKTDVKDVAKLIGNSEKDTNDIVVKLNNLSLGTCLISTPQRRGDVLGPEALYTVKVASFKERK